MKIMRSLKMLVIEYEIVVFFAQGQPNYKESN